MFDKILDFILDFFQTDGLLNQLGYLDGGSVFMEKIVDFVWGYLAPLFNNDWMSSIAYTFVELTILGFIRLVQIYLLCFLPFAVTSGLARWKKIVALIAHYLLINFLLGTDTFMWVFILTILGFIALHIPVSEIDYNSEEALEVFGSMKIGGQEYAGVRTEITEDGTCYCYFENGESKYLRPKYKGSLTYYDDYGNSYRKNGSSFQ